MRIIDYTDIPEFHNDTKTIEHLGKLGLAYATGSNIG